MIATTPHPAVLRNHHQSSPDHALRTATESREVSQLRAVLNEHVSLNHAFLHYADHRADDIRLLTQMRPCNA